MITVPYHQILKPLQRCFDDCFSEGNVTSIVYCPHQSLPSTCGGESRLFGFGACPTRRRSAGCGAVCWVHVSYPSGLCIPALGMHHR